MSSDNVKIDIRGVMPTSSGCAIFLACKEKTFVIYADPTNGQALTMAVEAVKKERPLTHDLMSSIFVGLGIKLRHIVINDVKDGTFYARLLLEMSNELGYKLVEVDARPSDAMVLAVQGQRPIFVSRKVLHSVDDMSEILERILEQEED